MVHIRDIAKITGVSKSTVSRVINNQNYVSEEVRKKVQKAIDQTGYTVNGNAVKLSTGKNFTIGVSFPENNSCYNVLINSLLYYAKMKSYHVLVLPTYYEAETEDKYFSLLERKLIDGLVLTSQTTIGQVNWEKLCSIGKIVSAEKTPNDLISMIYPDRKQVYDKVFSHLAEQGYTNIFFTVKRRAAQSLSTRHKIEQFEKYFGKAVEGKHYSAGIDGYNTGYSWALETFKKTSVPEVIYANGDDTAAGVIMGLKKLGIIHQRDYQVIGEGNMPYSEALGFSTIDFLQEKIGEEIVNFMVSPSKHAGISKTPLFIQR